MLGLVSRRHLDPEFDDEPHLPDNVADLLTPDHHFTVWGDFYVCPIAPDRAGHMRLVILEKAHRLFPDRS